MSDITLPSPLATTALASEATVRLQVIKMKGTVLGLARWWTGNTGLTVRPQPHSSNGQNALNQTFCVLMFLGSTAAFLSPRRTTNQGLITSLCSRHKDIQGHKETNRSQAFSSEWSWFPVLRRKPSQHALFRKEGMAADILKGR